MSFGQKETSRFTRRHLVRGALVGGASVAASSVIGAASASTDAMSFLSWGDEADMKPALDLFTVQSGLTVLFSSQPPVKPYVATLESMLALGLGPDVFILTAEDKYLVAQGRVRDLSGETSLDVMNSVNRAFMTVDGKAYGLSVASWAGGIVYNKALLARVGAEKLPDSWDDFLGLCLELKELGITPFYDSTQYVRSIALWALLGGHFAETGFPDADIFAGTTTFAATWTKPLSAYHELYRRKLVSDDVVVMDAVDVVDAFTGGEVAMFSAGLWDLPGVQKNRAAGLEYGIAAVPGLKGGTGYWAGAASPGFAINANAANPEAALKFLRFMASEDGVKAYGAATGELTTTSNYTPVVPPILADLAAGVRDGKIYLPVTAWPRHADALWEFLDGQLDEMIMGMVSPEEVANALDAELKRLDREAVA